MPPPEHPVAAPPAASRSTLRGCGLAGIVLASCLCISGTLYACGWLAQLPGWLGTAEPPQPGLEADYSRWPQTTFGPLLGPLLLQTASGGTPGAEVAPADECLLPGSTCDQGAGPRPSASPTSAPGERPPGPGDASPVAEPDVKRKDSCGPRD